VRAVCAAVRAGAVVLGGIRFLAALETTVGMEGDKISQSLLSFEMTRLCFLDDHRQERRTGGGVELAVGGGDEKDAGVLAG